MANRSYLYTHHPGETPEYRDLSEWRSEAPVAHLLLVGADAAPCPSAIWSVEEKIALRGDAARSRPLFLELLDWLAPQLPEKFLADAEEARALVTRADRQGASFHLELGEIFELTGYELHEMEREAEWAAKDARGLFGEVERLVRGGGLSLKDARETRLRDLPDTWEDRLGLNFSDVLYFSLGR